MSDREQIVYTIEDALAAADDLGWKWIRKRSRLARHLRLFKRRIDKLQARYEEIAGPLISDINALEGELKRLHQAIQDRGGRATYLLPTVDLRAKKNHKFVTWPKGVQDERTTMQAITDAGQDGLIRHKPELAKDAISKLIVFGADGQALIPLGDGEMLVLPGVTGKIDTLFSVTAHDDPAAADLYFEGEDDDGPDPEEGTTETDRVAPADSPPVDAG